MRLDLARVETLIREVAASEIIPRFRRLAAEDIREKQPGQIVTAADIEAERRLIERLPHMVPGSVVVGEEGVAADPALLDALWGTAPVWLVDPVDGTQNFSEGSPVFATMVALVRHRQTAAAWIYDPVNDRMAQAEHGAGAYVDGAWLNLAPPLPIAEMTGRLGRATARKLTDRIRGAVNLRCA